MLSKEIKVPVPEDLCVCGHSYEEHIQEDWAQPSRCGHIYDLAMIDPEGLGDWEKCHCLQFVPQKEIK